MNTAYKTRAWHFLRALTYAHDIVGLEGVPQPEQGAQQAGQPVLIDMRYF